MSKNKNGDNDNGIESCLDDNGVPVDYEGALNSYNDVDNMNNNERTIADDNINFSLPEYKPPQLYCFINNLFFLSTV